eukprot:gb/GEZN01001589.1/.p1 GENE.gb/GEZN01001589.1/~~gb/GEZN01001589.1/.p1  ORF type:complete len:959 (-),score=131.04 gb/GEZN01001589.1/:68-2812(-)
MEAKLAALTKAQTAFLDLDQRQIDEGFRAAALAANEKRVPLAKMAVQETGLGIIEDKVIKNHFASEFTYHKYKDSRTVGVIAESVAAGYTQVAGPVGPVLGIIPVTNPTSTAILHSLLCLKTRNALMVSPHPKAQNCTAEALNIIYEAAVKAGLPKGCISYVKEPSPAMSLDLLKRKEIKFVLATGGSAMVRACYSSGKPAVGVGAGNTPVLIDETVDLEMVASHVVVSKTFDNGTICGSEQSLVVVEEKTAELEEIFAHIGCHFLSEAEKQLLTQALFPSQYADGSWKIAADMVGQSAHKIAARCGITVPPHTKILLARCSEIGVNEPLSYEKLCPVLAYYTCKDYDHGLKLAKDLVDNGGLGHTSSLYTDERNKDRILKFEQLMPTGRVLVDSPSTFGGIGDLYNFALEPSLTLGCGSWGGSNGGNVGITNLLNIKNVAARRENMMWFRVPKRIFFKRGVLNEALKDVAHLKRVFVVSDANMLQLGHVKKVVDALQAQGFAIDVCHDVLPDFTAKQVKEGVTQMQKFGPDCVVAVGGGSVIDAAKAMRLLYEHPELKLDEMRVRFMDIRKRIVEFPKLRSKVQSVICIPTTSGTAAEVTPFVVITDEATGRKYPIADYALTPDIAIIDPEFSKSMPPDLTAYTGLDVLTHALESSVSVLASHYTKPLSWHAIALVFQYLPRAVKNGDDMEAREMMHNASTLAGMALSNAFLGINHSMAHALGSVHRVPHGLANALLLTHVINYLATYTPTKQAIFSQYTHYRAMEDYAAIADMLKLSIDDNAAAHPASSHAHKGDVLLRKCQALIKAIDGLKAELKIPSSIAECGIDEKTYLASINEMANLAFDDQCTGASPRFPLISEMEQLYRDAFYGLIMDEDADMSEHSGKEYAIPHSKTGTDFVPNKSPYHDVEYSP